MALCTCTLSTLVKCTFHSLKNGTMHMCTIRSGTTHISLPSQWHHAHAHHPLWYNASFTPFKMTLGTCAPFTLVPCNFHFLQNGTVHIHTIRSGTTHLLFPSQWCHAYAHRLPWYHAFFTQFTMVPCKCTPSALVPCIFQNIHNATMHMHTTSSGTTYHSHCKLVPCTTHVYDGTKYQRLHGGIM